MTTTTAEVAEFLSLHGPEHRADPHPRLAWVRRNMPVLRTPEGEHVVTTYAACRRLYDPASFRALGSIPFPGSAKSRTRELMADTIVAKNPPEHTRLRKVFTRDFVVRRIEKIKPATVALCSSLLDGVEEPLRDGATVDLMDLVRSLPINVLAEHLGVPAQDRREVFGEVPVILAAVAANADDETLARGDAASARAEAYFRDLVRIRRANPADDVVSAWASVGDLLSFDELMSMLWGMVGGGLGTTIAALGSGILTLLRHPDQTHWLARAPRAYTEEVLRLESPSFISGSPKVATRDVELDGTLIPEGALVRAMLISANRDERVYVDPDAFDPGRDNSRTLTFGHGIHLCLGANLARMEVAALVPLVHRRFPGLELAAEPVWQPPTPLRGLASLPVRLRR